MLKTFAGISGFGIALWIAGAASPLDAESRLMIAAKTIAAGDVRSAAKSLRRTVCLGQVIRVRGIMKARQVQSYCPSCIILNFGLVLLIPGRVGPHCEIQPAFYRRPV